MEYDEFLTRRQIGVTDFGFECGAINPMLYGFQRDIVQWAARKGRCGIFADCGLGKTPMQLEWARLVCEHTGGSVLILAPLAVAGQTKREGAKFGIDVTIARDASQIVRGINIANYEMLHHFDPASFDGIVLDESSILKNYAGHYRNLLIESFKDTPYRLCCTATPAPNDFMEIGNHSEFLGVMKRTEMLSAFFVHDGGDTGRWRLKGHAESDFYKWLASWGVMLRKPSDLGYDDGAFTLPALNVREELVNTDATPDGMLFAMEAKTLSERRAARKASLGDRVQYVADIVNESDDTWILWCNLNSESELLAESIVGAVEITGSQDNEVKERLMRDFTDGKIRVLVTKPSIAGYGMNWQHCANMAFVGLSDSYEQYYQAVRRCWRFGQTREVNAMIVTSALEGATVDNIKRKERDAQTMMQYMVEHMNIYSIEELHGTAERHAEYAHEVVRGNGWEAHNGDCVEVIKTLKADSVDYSVFSPPFADLYTYSDSPRDMGNAKDYKEFFEHFAYLIPELLRITKPGRLVTVHCMDLPVHKERDGYIGIRDFPGDIIRAFERDGFVFHSRVTIWKDPLVAATRTKALGLLHKQICKDSTLCRQGIADYLLTFRKLGENPDPVSHPNGFDYYIGDNPPQERGIKFSHVTWQKYASPVWMDINQTRTLQRESAREDKDEKHICPLQLDVIERCIHLWTNPGDVVFSPFGGIGSEGYSAVRMDRRAVMIELKRSYFDQMVGNMHAAEHEKRQQDLFTEAE